MIDESVSLELRLNAAIVLGSLAKGTEDNIQSLLDCGCISVLLKGNLRKCFHQHYFISISPLLRDTFKF